MLTGMKELLNIAQARGCAIPAFNVYNAETALGVIFAAEEAKACVILQMYSRLFTSYEAQFLSAQGVEVVLESDVGVDVEGELGHIGLAQEGVPTEYTRVDEAQSFVQETGVDALAILVGTAHGRYKQAPVIAVDRIAQIAQATGTALVLHGGSGVPDDQIRSAISAGIRKINFGTDVCYAMLDAVRLTSPDLIAVDIFMKEPTQAVKRFALEKIRLLGAEGSNE